MINLNPKVVSFIRSVLSVAVWAAASAVLTYVSNAENLSFLNGTLALLVAGIAGLIEHQLEKSGKGALFGAVNRAH